MPLHEQKKCSRCSSEFECKVGDIANCDCSRVHLTLEEQLFVETRYSDCLCLSCLRDLKNKYTLFKEKYFG